MATSGQRVLLDSNIVVHREAAKVQNRDIGTLFYWLDHLGYQKWIHPRVQKEIERLAPGQTHDAMVAKLKAYYLMKLEAPLAPQVQAVAAPLDTNDNDHTDTALINELFLGRVDLLITEDKKMHDKASRLGIGDRVFKIGQFIDKSNSENPEFSNYKTLSIRKELFGNLDVDDPLFASLRADYPEFVDWFVRKAEEEAYVGYSDAGLTAFMYLKVENEREPYHNIHPPFPPKRRLKIGTLKVAMTGYRLGERLLKIALENAVIQRVDEVYVTIFDRHGGHAQLIDLFSDFGFSRFGHKSQPDPSRPQELVFVRDMTPDFDAADPARSYPYFSRSARSFIVPIYPEYHTELFPDSILRTESPREFVENQPHRNAIRKVYISRSIERGIERGDNVIFYRTAPKEKSGYHHSVLTTITVVESVVRNMRSSDVFIEECKKRSVFTDEELLEQWNRSRNNRPFVVSLLYGYSLPKRPNLKRLIDLGIIAGVNQVPRGFSRISSDQFDLILQESQADARFVVD